MKHLSHFEVVCARCSALGVHYDFVEGGSPSTIITCSACGAPRGTLGDLQALASSNRSDFLKRDLRSRVRN